MKTIKNSNKKNICVRCGRKTKSGEHYCTICKKQFEAIKNI